MKKLLERMESTPQGSGWFLLLCGWILSRNVLEGILERPQQLGFDWREEISFPMMFLHFPIFYLALFVGICLWLHLLTRRPVRGVLRVVSLGFALLPLAPVIDGLLAPGRGYDLKYMLGFGAVLWRFWDPSAAITELSPGQRIEILLACLFAFLYVWAARRATSRDGSLHGRNAPRLDAPLALSAALGVFLMAAFLGAWPSLFARAATASAASVPEAYARVFQQGGLISGESRRLAEVMLLPLLLGLPVLLWRSDPRRAAAVLRALPWTRLAYYTGLVPAGAVLGAIVFHDHLKAAYTHPSDYAANAVLWAAMLGAFLAALAMNDLHDRQADGINAPLRPLVTGVITPDLARRMSLICSLGAVYLALCVSYQAGLLLLLCLFLSWAYSVPPLRLKRLPLLATGCLGLLSLLAAMTGYSLIAQEMTPLAFPRRLALLLFLGVTLGFAAKDLKDVPGDRASGVTTLATLLPERAARRWAAFLVGLAYLLSPILLPLGGSFLALSLAFALLSVFVTLKVRRPDTLLLAGFTLFCLLVLFLLAGRSEVLRTSVPPELTNLHARCLDLEGEVRELRTHEGTAPSSCGDGPPPETTHPSERLDWAFAQAATSPQSETVLAELIRTLPLCVPYWDRLVSLLDRLGRRDDAIAACSGALDLGLRPADFLRNRAALTLSGNGPADPAAEDLKGAFLFGRNRPLLLVLLGDELLKRNRGDQAVAAYAQACRLDPELPEAWAGLGGGLYAQKLMERSRDAFERARALRPSDPWTLNNLGVVLRDLGQLDSARAAFVNSHETDPGLFEPVFNLGLLAERLGKHDEARLWYAQAEALRPGFPPLAEAERRVGGSGPR